MKKVLNILLLTIVIAMGCHPYTCKNIPDNFPSSESAIGLIEKSTFPFKDEVKISDTASCWIPSLFSYFTSANYYSCDEKIGYFIFTVSRGSTYIRKGIPLEIWRRFKDTSAKGPYFETNIDNKYKGINIRNKINSGN